MIKQFHANKARLRRHQRIRRHLEGTSGRPRLNIFRSGEHIYAQIIDDMTGTTIVAASSLDESLRDFKPETANPVLDAVGGVAHAVVEAVTEVVEQAAEVLPVPGKGKGAKAEKPAKAPAKGQPQQKGAQGKGGKPAAQAKTVLPQAQKGEKRTPVEALAPIANNRKVALAREVGKLVAQRAKEKGVNRVVFDRGGYAYHGRVAALAEGAREVGLEF
jgi:ribosomal protein L18